VLVVVHRASWADFNAPDLESLSKIFRTGAVGLMNAPQGARSGPDPAAPFLTLGAGRLAKDPARPLELDTSHLLELGVLHVEGMDAARNANRTTGAIPGLLGAQLQRRGLSVAHTAGRQSLSPAVAAIGADTSGHLRFWVAWQQWGEWGWDKQWEASYHPSLGIVEVPGGNPWLDYVVGGLATYSLDFSRDLLIVLAPTTPPYPEKNRRAMAPVVVVGPGFGPGLLTSASTHQPGIISNTDIAPTILRFFGLDVPDAMTGHPLRGTASRDHVAALSRLDRATRTTWASRRPLIAAGVVWDGLALVLGALALTLGLDAGGRLGRFVRAALLLGLALPLGYLLQPAAPLSRAAAAVIVVFGWAAFAAWAAGRLPPSPLRVGVICAATALGLAAATATGSSLLWRSALGYEFMYGGRFYGIDNDLMLIWVACAAAASGVAADLWPGAAARRWLVAAWAATVLLIGAPFAGANWGGGVTAAVTGAAVYLALGPFRRRRLLGAAALLVAGLGFVLALHLLPGAQTHITEAIRLAAERGWGPLGAAVQRKWAANAQFVRSAPTLLAPAAALLVALFVTARPTRRWRAVFAAHPGTRAGLLAGMIGVAAGGLLNDSGALSVACAAPVLIGALLYVGLSEEPCRE